MCVCVNVKWNLCNVRQYYYSAVYGRGRIWKKDLILFCGGVTMIWCRVLLNRWCILGCKKPSKWSLCSREHLSKEENLPTRSASCSSSRYLHQISLIELCDKLIIDFLSISSLYLLQININNSKQLSLKVHSIRHITAVQNSIALFVTTRCVRDRKESTDGS